MKINIRLKLLILIISTLIPILFIAILEGQNIKNMPLIVISIAFSFFVIWILSDRILINHIIRLEKADSLKSKYIYISSHDLRTPMTAIKGLISMVIDGDYGPINQEIAEPLSDIKTSVERLIRELNDMITLSRIEDGRLKFDLTSADTKKVVEEASMPILPVIQQKGITLNTSGCKSLPVQADAEKLKQALHNLILHLVMNTCEKQINVITQIKGNVVTICITDIPGYNINNFSENEDFVPNGAGLSYYIAKEYTKKIGRELWLTYSDDKKKSAITFMLPTPSSLWAKKIAKNIMNEARLHPDQKKDRI